MSFLLKVTPNIASRFTAAKRHTAVIAYVPVAVPPQSGGSDGTSQSAGRPAWPLNPPPLGQSYNTTREAWAIKMWCCGPRHNNSCIPGARTTVLASMFDCCLKFQFCSTPVLIVSQLCILRGWCREIRLPSRQFGGTQICWMLEGDPTPSTAKCCVHIVAELW